MKRILSILFLVISVCLPAQQVIGNYFIDPNTALKNNYNRNYLKDHDAQISKIMQGTTSSTLIGMCIGDSWITQGNAIHPWASYLKTQFGDAGVGYFGAGSGNQGMSSGSDGQSATITRVGSWTNVSQNTYVRSVAIAADSSSTVSDSIYYVGRVTDVVVHYIKKTSGGSFVTRIDGTSPTTVSTSGTTGLNFSSITGLNDGTHTISIKVSSAGSGVLICGAELNRNQNGVRIHNLGTSGSTATEWIRQDSTNWIAGIQQLAPNLAVILLGVNDCAQNMTTKTYIGNITRMVNRILAAMPRCSIVLMSPSDIGLVTTYPMSAYVGALKNYALANNYGFIDNYSLLGDYTTANARGEYTNTSHVNSVGGGVIVQNFLNYLMNGKSMYYSNGNNYSAGENALLNATTAGTANVAIGNKAGNANTTAKNCTYIGYKSGAVNKTSSFGTYLGAFSGQAMLSGNGGNLFAGDNSGFNATTVINTTLLGSSAGQAITTGNYNTAVGASALFTTATGIGNTCVGFGSFYTTANKNYNAGLGYETGYNNSSGQNNTYVGAFAGFTNSSGSGNICLGQAAGYYNTNLTNRLFIGSLDNGSVANDSLNSILYGYQHTTPSSQRLYVNALLFPTYGIKGTTTNDNATAGNVGQTLSIYVATGSAVTMTTATAANVATLSLTAGDWLVSGQVTTKETTATVTGRQGGINTTSATIPVDGSEAYDDANTATLTENNTLPCAGKRISLSTTTTIYLVCKPTFAVGTVAAFGFINATRIR